MNPDVLLRRSYFKQPDGSYIEVRYFGGTIVWSGPAPVLFLDWRRLFQESPSLALVKEGPKALAIYRERN